MATRHVTVADLAPGLAVEYLGDAPDRGDVLDEHLTAIGMALFPGHPGKIWGPTAQHVQVTWVGLEDEPASFAVGFSSEDLHDRSTYPGLGHLEAREYERRRQSVIDALSSGRNLAAWIPPWAEHESDRAP